MLISLHEFSLKFTSLSFSSVLNHLSNMSLWNNIRNQTINIELCILCHFLYESFWLLTCSVNRINLHNRRKSIKMELKWKVFLHNVILFWMPLWLARHLSPCHVSCRLFAAPASKNCSFTVGCIYMTSEPFRRESDTNCVLCVPIAGYWFSAGLQACLVWNKLVSNSALSGQSV